MVSITGQPYSAAYNMSKFTIRGLSYSLEQELADIGGIHVCAVLPAAIDTPLFSHAANYMDRKVKAPEPVIPAQEVADAILKLVAKPKKEVIVGGVGKLTKLVRTLAPGLFDRKYKRMIEQNHFQGQPDAATTGNLYEPMPQWGLVSGGWLDNESNARWYRKESCYCRSHPGGYNLRCIISPEKIKALEQQVKTAGRTIQAVACCCLWKA